MGKEWGDQGGGGGKESGLSETEIAFIQPSPTPSLPAGPRWRLQSSSSGWDRTPSTDAHPAPPPSPHPQEDALRENVSVLGPRLSQESGPCLEHSRCGGELCRGTG